MTTAIAKTLVIRHEACSTLGLLSRISQAHSHTIHYLDPFQGERLSEPIEHYSHVVVLGGAVSAYESDRYPFLQYEFGLIEAAIAREIPIVGICLGAQILATVLGAKVYRGSAGREVGWCDIHLTKEGKGDRLLHSFPAQFKVFQSHQDTFDIPAEAVRLAKSDVYPNQAFCYRDRVWALQFHLEFDENVVSECASVLEQELLESGIQTTTLTQLFDEAKHWSPSVAPLADRFMQHFFQCRSPMLNC